MKLPTLDLFVIAAYGVGVFLFGCWFARRSSNTSGFMTAGGGAPGWAIGLSIFGTYLSSNTFLLYPGKAYGGDWNAFAFTLAIPVAALLATVYFIPFYRAGRSISAYEHLEEKFGLWARTYGVACYLLVQLARVGAVMFGMSLVLSTLTGWPQHYVIIAAGVLVTVYTAIGGIEAVIWTDVVQAVVLLAGALVLFGLLLGGMPEGPGQTLQIAREANKTSLGSLDLDLVRSTFWVPLLYGLVENLRNFGIDQGYVQRYHAARSAQAAQRSLWLGVSLYVPTCALFFAIGTASFAYYQTHPQMLADVQQQVAERRSAAGGEAVDPASLSDSEVADSVLPHFIVHGLPAGATGLLIAAICAAAMSSIDTSLNSTATVVLIDIYQRMLRPGCGERESMAVLYGATAVVGALGVAIALLLMRAESVLDAYWALSGVFAGGILGLFLLGQFARWVKNAAAAIAAAVGVLVVLWCSAPQLIEVPAAWRYPLHVHMTMVVGTLTVFLVGLAVQPLITAANPTPGEPPA
ncbi:Sodium/glucose cotransporter [Pirellulimonas nuda]|uniref:Sodium/glucose cotransporter n=1 Tax=Pirellulimonas nuda TaxID=2528009 RepID=A0A518DEF5_9BACT|nr:sodium/solute symporter [Pirellulimonas nuda]QDU89859.1 Sodium/glucose cotransporter [Pirellulimonas nuda]